MATFLDRDPYFRFWRPIYSVLGPLIRRCKAFVSGGEQVKIDYEQRLAALETAQKQNAELLEQVLVTILADRQFPRAIEEIRAIFVDELSRHAARVLSVNADQWAAIERLMVAVANNSNSTEIVGKNDYLVNRAAASNVDRVT